MDELIAIMTHAFLTRPDHDRLFIDATNAFNCISRKKAFQTSLQICPSLSTLIHSHPLSLWNDDQDLDQERRF